MSVTLLPPFFKPREMRESTTHKLHYRVGETNYKRSSTIRYCVRHSELDTQKNCAMTETRQRQRIITSQLEIKK